jgi:hypothetical protein
MKAKLILKHRGDYDYFLLSRTENSEAVQASLIPDDEFEQKLSKQNCDEIFGIVDVEKLAEDHPLEVSNASHGFGIKDGIVYGFNKALELNKDKVFTLKDVKQAIFNFANYDRKTISELDRMDMAITSIQQPTEIEVEIEMEKVVDKTKVIGAVKGVKGSGDKITTYKSVPKLDENGCLILKKI